MNHQANTIPYEVSAMPLEGDWFVLHTRSRQEKVLAADLMAMHLAFYLPLYEQVRTTGRARKSVRMPLFPGYVFLRGTLDQAYLADRTKRVANIIRVPDQQRLDWELRNIHLALVQMAPLDPYPYLKVGTRVEVRSGPFRGLQGVIESRIKPQRLILTVEILGRAMALEIDGAAVEPID